MDKTDQKPNTSSLPNPAAALIQITESAARQVRIVQEREGKVGHFLRLGVVGGGCSGLSYKLSFDEKPGDKDKVFDLMGIQVVVDPKSMLFLKGILLDFSDGLNGQGFEFKNPNAKSSCGCGSSFSA